MTDHKVGNKTVKVELDITDVDIIKAKTPVKTGALRDSFQITPSGDIVNPLDYADEVELGTVNRPGHFMVERSLDEISKRLAKRLAEQINQPGLITLPELVIKTGK